EFLTQHIGPVALGRDQTIDLGNIVLESEGSVSVLAQDPGGAPLARVLVWTSTDRDLMLREGDASGWTAENGVARLEGVVPGRYTLIGMASNVPPALVENVEVPIKNPGSPALLQFGPGGSLDIQILGQDGLPVPDTVPHILDSGGRDF